MRTIKNIINKILNFIFIASIFGLGYSFYKIKDMKFIWEFNDYTKLSIICIFSILVILIFRAKIVSAIMTGYGLYKYIGILKPIFDKAEYLNENNFFFKEFSTNIMDIPLFLILLFMILFIFSWISGIFSNRRSKFVNSNNRRLRYDNSFDNRDYFRLFNIMHLMNYTRNSNGYNNDNNDNDYNNNNYDNYNNYYDYYDSYDNYNVHDNDSYNDDLW